MKYMVLVKANKDTEAGVLPTEAELVEMHKFNEQLIRSDVMLAGEGLHPSSKGARIRFSSNQPVVIDGPFTETKELLAGFWIVQVKSKAEVLDLFKRAPFREGEIEIRQVFDAADFEPVIKTDAGRAVLEAEEEFRKAHNQ